MAPFKVYVLQIPTRHTHTYRHTHAQTEWVICYIIQWMALLLGKFLEFCTFVQWMKNVNERDKGIPKEIQWK